MWSQVKLDCNFINWIIVLSAKSSCDNQLNDLLLFFFLFFPNKLRQICPCWKLCSKYCLRSSCSRVEGVPRGIPAGPENLEGEGQEDKHIQGFIPYSLPCVRGVRRCSVFSFNRALFSCVKLSNSSGREILQVRLRHLSGLSPKGCGCPVCL